MSYTDRALAKKKERFLANIAEHFTPRKAIEQMINGGDTMSRREFHNWLESDPDFALAFADAREDALDRVEESLFDTATKGAGKDRTTSGAILLNGNRDDIYRQRGGASKTAKEPVEVKITYTSSGSDE